MSYELVNVAAGFVLGNSMSIGRQNSISVSIALELSPLSNGSLIVKIIQEDCVGNKQVVYDDSSNYLFSQRQSEGT